MRKKKGCGGYICNKQLIPRVMILDGLKQWGNQIYFVKGMVGGRGAKEKKLKIVAVDWRTQ